jgi:hypothetical protein
MASRFLAPLAAILGLVGSADADPVSYRVVTDQAGSTLGTTLTGTITFPESSIGVSFFYAPNFPGPVTYDFEVLDSAGMPLGPGFHTGGLVSNSVTGFSFTGVIGDPALFPNIDGAPLDFRVRNSAVDPSDPLELVFAGSDGDWIWGSATGFDASPHDGVIAWHFERIDVLPVPEACTTSLLAVGAAVAVWRRRRR